MSEKFVNVFYCFRFSSAEREADWRVRPIGKSIGLSFSLQWTLYGTNVSAFRGSAARYWCAIRTYIETTY